MYTLQGLALLVILIPCITCIQIEDHRQHSEGVQSIPYLDDVVAYLMDPHTESDDGDESEFDSVGHNEKETSSNEESPGMMDGEMEKAEEEKKSKIESVDEDDNLFTGMKLANINRDLLTVRDKITRHLDDTASKLTTNNDNTDPYDSKVSDKDQNLQVTKNLIGLLYDFKGKKHKRPHTGDDDLMDLDGSKKDDIKPIISKVKGDKEKIDVTVNVNINGIPKTKKKKSKVESSTTSSKKSDTPTKTLNSTKEEEEPADKRSIVRANKVSPTITSNNNKLSKVTGGVQADNDNDGDDDNDDDEDDEKDVEKTSENKRHEGTEAKTKVSSTLAHLKDVKAPPALVNQLKKKIQEEEKENDSTSEGDDDDDDDEDDTSGSGHVETTAPMMMATDKKNDVKGENAGLIGSKLTTEENTEKLGNNVHPDFKNSSLSAATNAQEPSENGEAATLKKSESTKQFAPKPTKDMSLEEVGKHIKKWQENKKSEDVDVESDEGTTRSWKEEKQKLVKKLKNPLMEGVDEEGGDVENEGAEEASDITKSADDAFTKVVDTVTTSAHVQKLKKSQEKDVKEVAASAEKAFSNVVNNVMSGKANEISLNHHALTKTANELISNVKDASHGANMKKLLKFKTQILSEIKKISKLQKQYGFKAKGAGDLTEARSVLEKDLKVVSELEGRLKKQHKQAEAANHDQKAFGQFAKSDSETIPDETLGFSPEDDTKKTKAAGKSKGGNNKLKEIQQLLKAEIKRLKKKKTGKPDPQLNDIRKMVQKKLKGFLKNGNLDKNAFKKLAPEIKELGNLLKHRIKNAKSYHKKVMKATKAATNGFAPAPVTHKGLKEVLNQAQTLLSATSPHNDLLQQSMTLQAAKNALTRIKSSNVSLVGSQSSKMKSLLTSLNSKLGKVFQHGGFMQKPQQQQGQGQQSYDQLHQIQGMNPAGQAVQVPSSFVQAFKPRPGESLLLPKSPYQAQALAKAETPEPDFDPDQTKPMAGAEPVNTLIDALERDITEVWSYKDQFQNAESLGLDNEKVHNAYANLGSLSGLSLRRALDRALRGEDVGLAIVGGSISKGGPFSEKGIDYILKSYFYAIEDYWNKIVRPVTGSSLIVRDCSIGGIATDYYSYCLRSHLPDDKLTNIVLWELSANDMKRFEESGKSRTQPLEQFVRNVISYRAKPSLIFVNFFANLDWDADMAAHCRNFEDEGGDDIAKYYKITSLSWRNMVCPELQSGSPLFTRDRLFSEDKFHPSIQGHAQVAYLLIDYIRTEFLKNLVKMRTTNIEDAVTRLQIPHSVYVPRPLFRDTVTWKPLCYTYMLTDDKMPNNTLQLDTSASGSFKSVVVRAFKVRSDKIAGMNTQDNDQHVSYTIHLPPHPGGGIQPYRRLGIMSFTDNRSANIQFDAEPTQTIETGKRFLEGTTIKYIAKDIRPGDHQLSVRSGNNGFLVCAILVG